MADIGQPPAGASAARCSRPLPALRGKARDAEAIAFLATDRPVSSTIRHSPWMAAGPLSSDADCEGFDQGLRAGLRSPAPLLRVCNIVQAQRRSDKCKMRECLRKIAKLPLRRRVVFFRQQANVVAQREQTLEQGARFGIPMLQLVIIGEPEAAREKHAFTRRQAVDV